MEGMARERERGKGNWGKMSSPPLEVSEREIDTRRYSPAMLPPSRKSGGICISLLCRTTIGMPVDENYVKMIGAIYPIDPRGQ